MAKKALLVYFSLLVRVVVDENATEDDIIAAAYPKVQDKIDNRELGDNLEEVKDDEEVPFGEAPDDKEEPTVLLIPVPMEKNFLKKHKIIKNIDDHVGYKGEDVEIITKHQDNYYTVKSVTSGFKWYVGEEEIEEA